MPYTQIGFEISDRILTLVLNRPERLNAFTPVMRGELLDAIGRADADDSVRAVILTGAGRAFCAGTDFGGEGEDTFNYGKRDLEDSLETHRDGGGIVALRIYDMKKPLIVAFNGPAVGVGITMTLPADIRIASETARIGFVFTRRGIVPEACSSWFLPRIVGMNRALEWVITGRVFSAHEALAAGLVSEVLAPEHGPLPARLPRIPRPYRSPWPGNFCGRWPEPLTRWKPIGSIPSSCSGWAGVKTTGKASVRSLKNGLRVSA